MTERSAALTRWLRMGSICTIAACLAGCAVFRASDSDKDKEDAALAQSRGDTAAGPASPAAAASAPMTQTYRLVVIAPSDLRKLLVTYLDLSRFQAAAVGDVVTSAELDRLAGASPAQARSLLETEGYFNPQISVVRSDPPGEKPLFELKVDPGPRTIVRSWALTSTGALQSAVEAGDHDAKELMKGLIKNWPMKEGEPFRQASWNSAKNESLAEVHAQGYPLANWSNTQAHIDAKTQDAELNATFDSGPLFRLGELRIEGLQRYDEGAIRNLADFHPGTPYSEKLLLDYQERIGKVGLFEGAAVVTADPTPENAEALPVIVKVREQTLQTATTGIGFNDNTRERVTLEHTHRRPFGFNVKAHNKLEIGRNLRSWEGDLLSNPKDRQYRNLIAAGVSRLDAAGDITLATHVRSGRSQETERIERLVYGELLTNNVTVKDPSPESMADPSFVNPRSSQAASINYNWIWRDVDNLILPTRGLTSTIQVAGGYARSNFADSGLFTRLYTRNTLYWPLGRSWFTQTRLEYGEVFAADRVGIPDTLLFKAGGDDSVRGYGYRELGIKKDNVLYPARKLLTVSAEIAHPFTSKRPELWWATFIDAGTVVDQWKDTDPALGYGVGVRWRSPVGPLRIDWAYGEQVHKGRLHLSVGIAF